MFPKMWQIHVLFLFTFISSYASGAYVGVSIGTKVSNIPSEAEIVSLLQSQNIRHVRLFNTDHQMLSALANTGIEVIVTVPNDQLLRIGESRAVAADWVKQNIVAFVPATNITMVAVGSEVLTSIPNAALILVPALQFLRSALVAADLDFQVKVSTPNSMDMIPKPFPPSTATFNSTWNPIMSQLLQFLKNTHSPFMLNAHPYYGYTQANGIFPLEYALFRPLSPNKRIVDSNTGLIYNNMLDAMIDAAYFSIQALNFSGIPVLVTETGWPSHGDVNEPDATVDNALVYNSNLMNHVLSNPGTPNQTNVTFNAYIFELFNEDQLPGPMSKRNWGLFSPNGTPMYTVSFLSDIGLQSNISELVGVFCVANATAESTALQAGLNWACGPGSANCSVIQSGQPCYDANIAVVASYAYNDYYHRAQSSGGSCNFGGTAFLTNTNPSHGLCIFAGSTGGNITSGTATATPIVPGPVAAESGGSRFKVSKVAYVLNVMLLFFVW